MVVRQADKKGNIYFFLFAYQALVCVCGPRPSEDLEALRLLVPEPALSGVWQS